LQGALDPGRPFHLVTTQRYVAVVRTVVLDSVATLLLRHIAGAVRCAEHLGEVERAVRNLDYADAYADAERPVVVHEAEISYTQAQLRGDADGVLHGTVLQQYAELFTAQSCKR